jgi:hypothetical protein
LYKELEAGTVGGRENSWANAAHELPNDVCKEGKLKIHR